MFWSLEHSNLLNFHFPFFTERGVKSILYCREGNSCSIPLMYLGLCISSSMAVSIFVLRRPSKTGWRRAAHRSPRRGWNCRGRRGGEASIVHAPEPSFRWFKWRRPPGKGPKKDVFMGSKVSKFGSLGTVILGVFSLNNLLPLEDLRTSTTPN